MALEIKVAVREGFLDGFLVATEFFATFGAECLELFGLLEHLDVTGDFIAIAEVRIHEPGALAKHCDVTRDVGSGHVYFGGLGQVSKHSDVTGYFLTEGEARRLQAGA
eukprot:CAMPEP_0171839882 /NCGR_PEP_ID=MMETSP0992-20121227/13626_1 /TAXON_ID=483369 /ORGANISM="non described non described, Strain CCMP2098" /LENGTH=107 /DNA_ID=CAMNT_0012456547 /DNA_START=45 /DNA_END=364 /DNA_ORIENTATION=-